jgi:hypothetical protein
MTDSALTHLSEAERHGAADGTLAPELVAAVGQHLEACDVCAADVARIKTLMTRMREAPTVVGDHAADLWPGIRARIEQDKVASLHARRAASAEPRLRPRRTWFAAAGVVAAGLLAAVVIRRNTAPAPPVVEGFGRGSATLTAVAESTHVYEEQIRFLLNELELRRALMRPQTAASMNHDLEVIDNAIAELKRAIERDPNNIALRALLAQSYRQKVDLLKRITNAG